MVYEGSDSGPFAAFVPGHYRHKFLVNPCQADGATALLTQLTIVACAGVGLKPAANSKDCFPNTPKSTSISGMTTENYYLLTVKLRPNALKIMVSLSLTSMFCTLCDPDKTLQK